MGLSDQERLVGMMYAVRGIHEAGEKLAKALKKHGHLMADNIDRQHIPQLVRLSRGMWHAMLGNVSNGTHWIFGSSSHNRLSENDYSPWAVALRSHWGDVKRNQEEEKRKSWNPNYKEPFDAMDMLSIEHLLYEQGRDITDNSYSIVYEIYSWCEQLIYYLRRYRDEFLSSFSKMDKMLSLMMGHCFSIFTRNVEYAKAYLMHDICKMLYGPGYPYNEEKADIVTKWMVHENSHHDINSQMNRRPPISLEELGRLHRSLIKLKYVEKKKKAGKDPEMIVRSNLPIGDEYKVQRMIVMLELTGYKLVEYEHVLKEFWKRVDADPLMSRKDVKARITAVIEKSKKAREDKKKERDEDYEDRSAYDEGSFYGLCWEMDMEDESKEELVGDAIKTPKGRKILAKEMVKAAKPTKGKKNGSKKRKSR